MFWAKRWLHLQWLSPSSAGSNPEAAAGNAGLSRPADGPRLTRTCGEIRRWKHLTSLLTKREVGSKNQTSGALEVRTLVRYVGCLGGLPGSETAGMAETSRIVGDYVMGFSFCCGLRVLGSCVGTPTQARMIPQFSVLHLVEAIHNR